MTEPNAKQMNEIDDFLADPSTGEVRSAVPRTHEEWMAEGENFEADGNDEDSDLEDEEDEDEDDEFEDDEDEEGVEKETY